ncbi:MAG: hypothetical protein AB2421_18330 [Thermotaleaceae bacterium]
MEFFYNYARFIFPVTGTISMVTLVYGFSQWTAQFSISKITKTVFVNIREKSEAYAEKTKTVAKAEELGVKLTAGNYLVIVLVSILSGLIAAFVFRSIYLIIIGFLIGYMLPENIIEIAKTKKQKEYLISSIPSVERIATQSMHTPDITRALIDALPDMKEPFKSEIKTVLKDVNSGKATLEEALNAMVLRTKSRHLKKVANSIKFADTIGGEGAKLLQRDANLLYQDKIIYEKAEARLKSTKSQSYTASLVQLVPFGVLRVGMVEMYDYIMSMWLGKLVLFIVMLKILLDFYITSKKARSLMN